MKIVTALYTHYDDDMTLDTLDSIKTWMTEDVIVILDGANTHNYKERIKDTIIKVGLPHGSAKSTHKNMALSIDHLHSQWPDADWYCFIEPDVILLNDSYKKELNEGWVRGTDYRDNPWDLPLLNEIVEFEVPIGCYFIGCIQFLHNDFVKKLYEMDFFNRFARFGISLFS